MDTEEDLKSKDLRDVSELMDEPKLLVLSAQYYPGFCYFEPARTLGPIVSPRLELW